MSDETKKDLIWDYLKQHGIYTEEELDKALKKMDLNISMFV